MSKKITLPTGIEITQNKQGNITSLVSPHDEQKSYGEQCVEDLTALFKSFNYVR